MLAPVFHSLILLLRRVMSLPDSCVTCSSRVHHEQPDPSGRQARRALSAAEGRPQADRPARSAGGWRSSRRPPIDPREVQEALLRGILAHQAATAFGRDHRFDAIRTVADFRRQLPVAGYEYFEPYIARVRRGETTALLADPRVHMFALTSGTTAVRKFIPVTQQYLDDYRRGWNIWGLKVFRDHPEVRMQPILQMSGDRDEFRTESGVPCGAVTGLTAQMQKRIIRWLYCVPACVARIKDPRAKYYAVLRLSMPRKVGMIIAANPSTLINLARAGDQEKESLIRDLHDGTLIGHLDLPADIRAELTRRLRKHPERARQLEEIVNRTGTLYPKDYWPSDCMLGNWMGGSVGSYLRHYPRYFGATPVRDVGLIASEGRMTIPLADGTPAGVLDVTTHYFEFIPEAEGDSPQPTVLGAHELKEGANYFILLTTAFGLYRYHIHDLVRVAGFHNGTPLIEFLSKGAHFANLTGEKLSEYHVTQAMADVLRELDLTLTAYSLAPCWPNNESAHGNGAKFEQPYYGLFVEQGDLSDADCRQSPGRAPGRAVAADEYRVRQQARKPAPGTGAAGTGANGVLAALGSPALAQDGRNAGAIQASLFD